MINAFNDQDAKNSVLTLDIVNGGDLIIRDLAYMHLESLQGIVKKLGHFLCRLNTMVKVYQKINGKMIELDFYAIVKKMRKLNIQKTEKTVFIGKDQEFKVRLFMHLLPEAVYNERIRKKTRWLKVKVIKSAKSIKLVLH